MSLLFRPMKSIIVPGLREKLLEKPVLLDARTPVEYWDGHIKGAKNIPLQGINRYDGDKKKTVYVTCQSGMRNKRAAKRSERSGYDMVGVRDGVNQWLD